MKLLLEITGTARPDTELEDLRSALRADPDLRRLGVEPRVAPAEPGAMSGLLDGLVVVFGAGGLGVTLAQGLGNWLANRRSTVRLKVTAGDRSVEIDVTQARDIREVVALLGEIDALPGPGDGEG
jgi:hypothetical protein